MVILEDVRRAYRKKLDYWASDQAERDVAKAHGIKLSEAYAVVDNEVERVLDELRKVLKLSNNQEASDFIYGKTPVVGPGQNPRLPKYRISLVRESSFQYEGSLTSSTYVFEAMKKFYQDVDREMLVVLTLDSKNKPIGMNIVSVGSLSSSIAHPREIMKMAVLQNAAAIIIVHNHPSGNPMPSVEDEEMTKRLMQAGAILGIRVLDSIVVGETDFYSFQDMGRMK